MPITITQPIFKRGSVTSSNLFEHTYTDRELEQVCKNYDPTRHKAPVQIGHVESTSPAYGWIEKLVYDRGRGVVMATVSYLDEAVDVIRKKLYQFVSATFYPPNCPNHPKNGSGFYLKALALLGAQPPAVKGLPPLEFCDYDPECVTCDLIRESLPEDFYESIDEIKNELYGVHDRLSNVEVKQDSVLELQQRVRQLELEKEKIQLTHYINDLFHKGNITPAQIQPDKLMGLLLSLKGYQEEVCYSDGEDSYTCLTTLLNSLKTVSYSEIPDLKEPLTLSKQDLGSTPHEQALNLMKQKSIKYRDALKEVLIK
ncbi:MAG: hypothetical protein ACRDBG_26035 [Waterburya sp.]